MARSAVLRYVPGSSPIHRLWAGTKIVVLTGLSLAIAAVPTWRVELAAFVVLLLAALLARLPRGWLPHLPAWLVLAIFIPVLVGGLRGGDPHGFGGLLTMLRGTGVALLFLLGALLLAATTPSAAVPPALEVLLRPLRPLRVPVTDVVLVTALSVRCLPLLVEEVSSSYDAWRLRLPATERRRPAAAGRFLVTIITVSARRARELAESMHARGGPAEPPRQPVRAGWPDGLAMALLAGVVAVAVLTA